MGTDNLQQTTDSNDLNKCVEDLTNFTVVVMNKVVPEKQLRVRQHSSPWAQESEVQEAGFQRNLAHRKALKYNTLVAWHKYRQLRNKATAILRSAKSSYYHRLADEIHQQPHRFWKEFCHLSNQEDPQF